MGVTILLVLLVIIFLAVFKGYKKGSNIALYDLVMLPIFYLLFIVISFCFNFVDYDKLVVFVKYHLLININIYDSLISLMISIIINILLFIILSIFYPLIKLLINKLFIKIKKNKDKVKGIFIGLIKGIISSFLLLCIINQSVSKVPMYLLNDRYDIHELQEYKDSKLIKLTNIKIYDYYLDEEFVNLLSNSYLDDKYLNINKESNNLIDIFNEAKYLTNDFKEIDYETISYLIDKVKNNQLIDHFSTLIIYITLNSGHINSDIDESLYDHISISKELQILDKLLIEINKEKTNYSKVTTYLYQLDSIDILCYLLLSNLVDGYFDLSIKESNEIAEVLSNMVVNKEFKNNVLIIDELYESFINIVNKNNIKSNINVLINNILKINFIEKIGPIIIKKLVAKLPNEYSSLIDTTLINESNLKVEINTILSIFNILFIEKEDSMAFDFSMIKKLSIDGVLKSDILSNGFIKLLIDASNNKGLLKKYSNYISVPHYLQNYDNKTKKYHNLWYGNNGELATILKIVKNALSTINKKNDANTNLVNVLFCLNDDLIKNSEVIFYSFNKILLSIDVIKVPESSLIHIDGINYINKDSLKDFIDTLCNISFINYHNVINNDFDNMFVYVSKAKRKEELDRLLSNNIALASISYIFSSIKEVVIKDNYSTLIKCLSGNNIIDMRLIDKKELRNILSMFLNMNISFSNFSSMKDFVKDSNKNDFNLFFNPLSSSYSELVHTSFSKLVLENIKNITEINTIKIVDKYKSGLIDSEEIINLLNAAIILESNNVDIFNLSSLNVDRVSLLVLNNKELLNSFIIKEMLLSYIDKYS